MDVKIITPVRRERDLESKMLESLDKALSCNSISWQMCVGPNIANNRNQLIDTSREYNLFWDSDVWMEKPLDTIRALVDRGKSIVCAAYQMRKESKAQLWTAGINGKPYIGMSSTGIHKVSWVGAGFLLVKVSVFEKLQRPYFRHEIVGDEEVSDDIGFCRLAERAGLASWLDCDNSVNHNIGG